MSPAGRTPPGASFVVDPVRAADGFLLDGPALRLDYEHPSVEDLPVPIKVAVNSQVIPSLDNDFFDPGYVSHTGILESAAVRDLFNQLIAPAAPPQGILDDPLGVVKRVFTLPSGGP